MKVNVDKDWTEGDSVNLFGWDSATAARVGDIVLLENYMNEFDFDVWQSLTIPLTEMNLDGRAIDAFRMQLTGKDGPAPTLYIDEFQLEEAGGSVAYTYAPAAGEKKKLTRIKVMMADATTAESPWNQFHGVSELANGILVTLKSRGEVIFTGNIKKLADFIALPGSEYQSSVGAANSWFTVQYSFETPIIMTYADGDHLTLTINDDLSGLDFFKTFVRVIEDV